MHTARGCPQDSTRSDEGKNSDRAVDTQRGWPNVGCMPEVARITGWIEIPALRADGTFLREAP